MFNFALFVLSFVLVIALCEATTTKRKPTSKPSPPLPTYPLRAGDIYRDDSGNVYYFSRDSHFPHNPEIFKITKYSAVTDTFALCSIESATFVTKIAAFISGYGFFNIKKTSTGVILYARDEPDSAITLTAIKTNPLRCGTVNKPLNKLQLLKSNDYSLNYYDYSLVVYNNMFVTGNIRDNANGNYFYKSAKFSMTTGEDLGFLTISNKVIPNTYYGGSFTAIQAYDGQDFYSSCHCGGSTGLVKNSTGLIIETGISSGYTAAAKGKLFVLDERSTGIVKVFNTTSGQKLSEFHPLYNLEIIDRLHGMTVSNDASTLYVLASVEYDYTYLTAIFKCSAQTPTQVCTYKFYESLNDEYEDAWFNGLTMSSANSVATVVESYSSPTEYYIHTYSV